MKNLFARWSAAGLGRLRAFSPVLLTAVAMIVAACNNGSGGSGY